MSQKDKDKKLFKTIIKVNDESGEFLPYWTSSLKSNMNDIFCNISLNKSPTSSSTLKALTSFNLTLKRESTLEKFDSPLFTINVYRMKKDEQINADKVKAFKEKIDSTSFQILLIDCSEANDSGIKACVKQCDKLKKEVGHLVMIPFSKDITGAIYSSIGGFLKELKTKLTEEFNKKLAFYYDYFTVETKDVIFQFTEEQMYKYIDNKQSNFKLLLLCDFYQEIQRMCNDDLFKTFKPLSKPFPFSTPYSLSEPDENEFLIRVKEQTLCNLEYQQFLFSNMLISLTKTKNIEGLLAFIKKILSEVPQYNSNFKSMFHFYYWNFLFITQINSYITSLNNETEPFIKTKIDILYYLKKILKNYATISGIEILNGKIFTLALNNTNHAGISSEMNSAFNAINEEIENNKQYQNFLDDIKENGFNEESNSMFIYQKKFFESYLKILRELNKLHKTIHQEKFSTRITIEAIPFMFALSEFNNVKKAIIDTLKKNDNWEYTKNYLQFVLVILINCLDRTEENLQLMLDSCDVKMKKIEQLIKLVDCEDENIVETIISKYINTFDSEVAKGKIFNLNKICEIQFTKGEGEENKIHLNLNKSDEIVFEFNLKNSSGYNFKANSMKIEFTKKFSDEKVQFDLSKEVEIKSFAEEKVSVTFNCGKSFKVNEVFVLSKMQFVISNGIIGECHINDKKSIEVDVTNIDMTISSFITPSYDTKKRAGEYYYNVLFSYEIQMNNIPDTENKKVVFDFIDKSNEEHSGIKLHSFILQDLLKEFSPKISSNQIVFENCSFGDSRKISIPFTVEDTNFYNTGKKLFLISLSILEGEEIVYKHTEEHTIQLSHLFTLSNKYRLFTGDKILMQTTFSLNLPISGIKIYTENSTTSKINLDISQAINFVTSLNTKNLEENEEIISRNSLIFSIGDDENKFRLVYPSSLIKEEIKQFLEMPYRVIISIDETEVKVFEEFTVKIKIQKFIKEKVMLIMKMKESDNCSVIGKSKIIEILEEGEKNIESSFKVFPLVDGYVKIPIIDFSEIEFSKDSTTNAKDFKEEENPLRYGSIIEGNGRIVKVNSVNSLTLRLNLT